MKMAQRNFQDEPSGGGVVIQKSISGGVCIGVFGPIRPESESSVGSMSVTFTLTVASVRKISLCSGPYQMREDDLAYEHARCGQGYMVGVADGKTSIRFMAPSNWPQMLAEMLDETFQEV
jgi:hypothetical protein